MSSDDEDFEDMMMASDYPYSTSAVPGTCRIWKGPKTTLKMKFAQNSTPTTLPRWSAVSMFWQVPTTAVPDLSGA